MRMILERLKKLFRRERDEQDFWRKCLKDVKNGKRPDPLNMTASERSSANQKFARRLKFTSSVVPMLKMPMLLRAAQNNGYAKDALSGSVYQLGDRVRDGEFDPDGGVFVGMTAEQFNELAKRQRDEHERSLLGGEEIA